MITADDLNAIEEMINTRRDQVLQANEIEAETAQHAWISGIYEDISGFLKSQFE
jgi:hypothetical protein